MILSLVLTWEMTAWLVVAVLVALYLARIVLLHAKLRKFNGPPGVSFTNYKHIRAMLGKRRDEWYQEVSDKHGKLRNWFIQCKWEFPNISLRTNRANLSESSYYLVSRALGLYLL